MDKIICSMVYVAVLLLMFEFLRRFTDVYLAYAFLIVIGVSYLVEIRDLLLRKEKK